MMRSTRPCAGAAVCKLHARALCARQFLARAWSALVCVLQAATPAHGRLDRIIVQRFANVAQ
eukprot:763613-Lingulodinium_polyedra.AAC.1